VSRDVDEMIGDAVDEADGVEDDGDDGDDDGDYGGMREARETAKAMRKRRGTTGFSRLDVGQCDVGNPRVFGREGWCATNKTALTS